MEPSTDSFHAALRDAASEPYRKAGRFAYHFARGKLGADPVFRAILHQGLLSGRERILDLGCGQGLLTSWLSAAGRLQRNGTWPNTWPPPPEPCFVRGIELMPRDVARARTALGPRCEVTQGDIRRAEFGGADAVVILDVLHYMEAPVQRSILRRVRECLQPGGLLLLRVGDAGGGLRFRITRGIDAIAMLARGHGMVPAHCRSVQQWQEWLGEYGFDVKTAPMSQGTPFANVLLIAHAR
jgi:SAM-dependent methyltransferase